MEKQPVPEAHVDEVLPPEHGGKGVAGVAKDSSAKSETARILAYWLDEFIRIPGTNFRIGLDPIMAFFPVIGDFLASSAGAVILLESVRCGVSFPVLIRMGGNLLLNTFFDAIPGIGPFFSAFFKSNSRNITLLKQWQAGHKDEVRRSTWRLFGLLALLLLVVFALWGGLWAFYIWILVRLFS